MLFTGILGLILGVIFYLNIYKDSHDALNPIALMIILWYASSFISSLRLASFQGRWLFSTCSLILCTGMLMYFWWHVRLRPVKFSFENDSVQTINRTYKFLTRILFVFCAVACMYSLYTMIVYGNAQTGVDAKSDFGEAVKGVPHFVAYGNILIPYLVLCSFFELLYDKKRNWFYNVFVIAFGVVYIWFVMRSRGTLSICLFGAVFMISRKKNWRLGKAFRVIVLIVVLFTVMMLFRVNRTSSIYSGKFSNVAINATYNYIAASFENLNNLITHGSHYTPLANVSILLYKLLGIYQESTMSYSEIYVTSGFYNASPFIACYYFDLGVIGIVLGVSVVSILILQLYRRANKNIYAILALSAFQKGVFTLCLGDNIINRGSFSSLLGYFVIFIICILSQALEKRPFQNMSLNLNGRT